VLSSWTELVELASRGTGSKTVAPLVISRLVLTSVVAAIAADRSLVGGSKVEEQRRINSKGGRRKRIQRTPGVSFARSGVKRGRTRWRYACSAQGRRSPSSYTFIARVQTGHWTGTTQGSHATMVVLQRPMESSITRPALLSSHTRALIGSILVCLCLVPSQDCFTMLRCSYRN
jgi:hypothetical protein